MTGTTFYILENGKGYLDQGKLTPTSSFITFFSEIIVFVNKIKVFAFWRWLAYVLNVLVRRMLVHRI